MGFQLKKDVVIIGAGASGLMCGIEAGKRSRSVLIIDHARQPVEKIRISGGGHCNFTNINLHYENYHSSNMALTTMKRKTDRCFVKISLPE